MRKRVAEPAQALTSQNRKDGSGGHLLRRILWRASTYVVAFALLFTLDNAVESKSLVSVHSLGDFYASVLSPSSWYPAIFSAWKPPHSDHVAVIIVGHDW